MKKFAMIGLIALIIGGLGTIFHWEQLFMLGSAEQASESMSFDSDQVETIIVDSDVAELNFFKTDSDDIDVDLSVVSRFDIEDIFTVNQSNQTLQLTIKEETNFLFTIFPFIDRQLTLNVGLPDSFSGSIDAEVNVGHIQLNDLVLDQFSGYVDVGMIEGQNMVLNNGSAVTNVGEIDLSMVTGEWYLETDVGDLRLDLLEWQGKVEAYSNVGDITIKLPEEPENYTLDLESDLGDITGVDSPVVKMGSQQDPSLEATSDIGDIDIQWNR
ncbi:DUF4097 family beta strand repeat-containing protein [Amphibacillus sp. Q70]|uniref:DUF4097 family beta strand repeat-containing protein n=1 Tax=Amphibacillus sp. Q70 TaxID=3453416 RepID=UPI003F844D7D